MLPKSLDKIAALMKASFQCNLLYSECRGYKEMFGQRYSALEQILSWGAAHDLMEEWAKMKGAIT
ncbi:hypothetical protein AOU00_24890 [Paenibacillus polymyxa]|nr:hypothetical protein AOU00_24890 [Paenibacillus polymyxa]KYG93946.1 hypothetical protein AZE31_08880 [Paenibacillus polymyxa]